MIDKGVQCSRVRKVYKFFYKFYFRKISESAYKIFEKISNKIVNLTDRERKVAVIAYDSIRGEFQSNWKEFGRFPITKSVFNRIINYIGLYTDLIKEGLLENKENLSVNKMALRRALPAAILVDMFVFCTKEVWKKISKF